MNETETYNMLKSLECLADKLSRPDTVQNSYLVQSHQNEQPTAQLTHLDTNIREMKENSCTDVISNKIENVADVTVSEDVNSTNDNDANNNNSYNNNKIENNTDPTDEFSKEVPDPDNIKMFVGQIPKSMDEIQLKKMFEVFGRIYAINVLRDKITGVSKGCCFVTFFTRKAALRAQDVLHNIKTLEGMHHPVQMKPADSENRNERKLFVGMLNKKFSESDVRQLFSGHGLIEECTVLRDQNGQSKGCAFVTFSTKQAAIGAIKALHQSQTMEGCSAPLVVKFADTQKEKEQKKIQQLQSNLWSISGASNGISNGGSVPLGTHIQNNPSPAQLQPPPTSLGTTQQILTNPPQQMNPFLADTLSSPSLLFQQLQSVNLQQQFLQGLNTQPDHSPSIAATGLMTPITMQNLFSNPLCISMTSHPQMHPHTISAIPNQALSAQLTNPATLWSGSEALAAAYPPPITPLANGPFSASQISTSAALAVAANAVAGKQIEGPEGSNLFIYHLPQEFTDTDLASTFLPFGSVLSAKVFIDKQTNLSKCFGFVSYDNPNSAHAAIQAMHGFQIGTKRLKVQLKRSKDAAKPY